jgi:hypothetical protein
VTPARRFLAALAATFVLLTGSMVWTSPAQAAPGGACSVEEWQNPKNFIDCVKRTGNAAAEKAGCVAAPTPDSPTSGLSGTFTTEPDSAKRNGIAGQYSRYGVGGYGLDTYDLGCLGTVKHPNLTFYNTVADGEFTIAKTMIGWTNGLRERAYDPGSMWGWADGFLEEATTAVYDYVFSIIGALTLLVIGGFLLWRARNGNMSEAVRITCWALFVMIAVTGVAKWPVASAHGADAVASKGLALVHNVLGPGPVVIDPKDCVLGGDSCDDNRTVAVRASDAVTEAVLYRNWVTALLGDADSPTAQKYGRALYDATSMSWGEAARADQSPALRQQLLDDKARTFNTIAEQIRNEDPLAYEHLQGIHGQDRAGSGFLAVSSAALFAAFDSMASIVILFGFGVFRIAIILLPLLGTIGLFLHASSGVRRVFHAVTAGAVNIVVFGGAAGFYLTSTVEIFDSPIPGGFQIVVIGMIGVGLLILMHPIRQLIATSTGRSRKKDGFTSRLFIAGQKIREQRQQDPNVIDGTATEGSARPRPETTSTARTVGAALFPSVGETAQNRVVTTATTAANRPENTTTTDRARSVFGELLTVAAGTTKDDPAPAPAPARTDNRS